jgi:SNF2 family DNA or RNA helicase
MFAHHVDLVKSIRDKFDALAIYGETSMKEKQIAVEEFQNNPDEQLIVISLQAGSEGITLTSASNVAFAELGWTPAEHDQAEDRCHRIGQKDFVNAWYLIARDTIDELIMDIIEEKRRIFNKSVNGGELGETKDIADEIIDILKD